MSLTKYSISKDPSATNLTQSKNSTNQVLITKNTGSTKAYFTKSGGTEVSVVKNDEAGIFPTASGETVNATTSGLTYSAATSGSTGATGWSMKENGAPLAVTNVTAAGSGFFITHASVTTGTTLLVSYDGTGDMAEDGVAISNLTDWPVNNNE